MNKKYKLDWILLASSSQLEPKIKQEANAFGPFQIGDHNKDIYYRDKNGFSNDDYLTLGVDQLPLFCGRTALQCYEDFMLSFVEKFESFIGSVIEEISIGLGPSGELRYFKAFIL